MGFITNWMTLERKQGKSTTVLAHDLPVQLDTVNIDFIISHNIPRNSYDLSSHGWTSPVPLHGDYFVDQATTIPYQVFGEPAVYSDHLEVRVTKYGGGTPN